ncbi:MULTISPECIES: excinuclease ATPase subunit [Cupriavidus]|uniref:Excinuclease ATPase subunit n=1 Tax=Cupriavidus pauculus TaxID=82633 RepID=A0A3G8H5E5_9BURK|nr:MULTISPECIES: excinuclease ATPase subunit [Cupriavidus]AZG15495.1 excinuclease ATPase subunit [Cupriavidus pauculus]MDT6961905.1 excinuclease ATPase subunit [Cupriavidus sp. SZY C1]
MKFALPLAAVACAASLLSTPAAARDTKYMLPLADVLNMPEAKEKLDGSVKFYLAGAPTPTVLEKKDSDVSNRKTNGVGKSDEDACRWAALSALISFQDKARTLGANAVIDMVSYYRKDTNANATDYECHAGAVVVGVALKGTFARVAQ